MSAASVWLRETRAMMIAEGLLDPVIIHRGKHLKIEGTIDGRIVSTFVACTPSDWRAQKNNRSRIRRMIREATA
jgi:hypothetical protein